MFAMNLNKLNVNEAELKAYIYQQLNDIQSLVGETEVGIRMTYNDEHFVVKMQASHEAGEIEVEGFHKDVYSALSQAKHALIRTFSSLDNREEESDEEREQEIQDIVSNKTKPVH